MEIPDSLETLRAALAEHRGTARELRVRLLIELAEHPEQSISSAAQTVGIPRRTATRWVQIYEESGLNTLLWRQTRGAQLEPEPVPPAPEKMTRFIALLNSLPMSTHTPEWGAALGQALTDYLEDVDYVVVNVRYTINLLDPASEGNGVVYHQDRSRQTARTRARMARTRENSGWKALYERAPGSGFAVDQFQYPVGFDYEYQGARIGSLLLFRWVGKAPISQATKLHMEELRPFIVYILSDHVARRRLTQPADSLWRDLLDRIAADAKLTERERQIIPLLIGGYIYSEIADSLHISTKTVDTHVKHIFRKLGVRRLRDLFARYITPRLPDGP